MSDGGSRESILTPRRRFLLAGAVAGSGAMGLTTALDRDGDSGFLRAGDMNLAQAYKIAEGEGPQGRITYQGPDGVKERIDGQVGDRYEATDTDVDYYYAGDWQARGVGSRAKSVPEVHAADVSFELQPPIDISNQRSLNTEYENTTGNLLSINVDIAISEDIGSTNSSKQAPVLTKLNIGPETLQRRIWDELKLYTSRKSTVVSTVLHYEFIVTRGETYKLTIPVNGFNNEQIDRWTERAW